MYRVVKRDNFVAAFDIKKISEAIIKAFEATEKQYNNSVIDLLALKVTADFEPKIKDGLIAVEDIQDSCLLYTSYAIPTTIFVDSTGKVLCSSIVGSNAKESWAGAVDKVLEHVAE